MLGMLNREVLVKCTLLTPASAMRQSNAGEQSAQRRRKRVSAKVILRWQAISTSLDVDSFQTESLLMWLASLVTRSRSSSLELKAISG